jgi:hypothetical protein
MKSHLYPPVLICLLDRVVVATFAILVSTLHRAKVST